MRRILLGFVLGFAIPAVARADDAGLRDQVRIGSSAEIGALCDELGPDVDHSQREQAREAVYVISLPATAWSFAEYDAKHARLAVDTARGFRGGKALWELMLHDLGGHVLSGSLDMAIPATAKEAGALMKAQKAGQLALTLWFRPSTAGKGAPCAVTHTREGEGVRLAIEPMAFAIERGKDRELVASGATDAFEELRDSERTDGGAPEVSVAAPVLTDSPGDAPDDVARATRGLEPALLACYREGLAADPQIQGTIVVGVDVARGGAVATAHAEIDGLGAPAVTRCALGAVQATHFPRSADPFSFAVTFAVK
jgi:hypothetical protein